MTPGFGPPWQQWAEKTCAHLRSQSNSQQALASQGKACGAPAFSSFCRVGSRGRCLLCFPPGPLFQGPRHNTTGCWSSSHPKTQRGKIWVGIGFLSCTLSQFPPTSSECQSLGLQALTRMGLEGRTGGRRGRHRGLPVPPPCPDSLGSGLGPLGGWHLRLTDLPRPS